MTFETIICKPRCPDATGTLLATQRRRSMSAKEAKGTIVNIVRSIRQKDTKLKDSKALLLEYLASIRDPEGAASLFAEDVVFELPFLRSLGVGPRYTGRGEIAALLHQLLKL